MRQETEGRRASFSFFRCLSRLGKWAALALILAWTGLNTPVHAAEKAAAKKSAAAASAPAKAAPAKTAHVKLRPGEILAKPILDRGRPSDKDNDAVLMPLTGTWDYLETFWTDPKVTPQPSMGTATNDMVLENHFLSSRSVGTLDIGGRPVPFEGQELIGYDTGKKAFSCVSVDSLTTGMMTGTGIFDDKKHTLTEKGRFTNPLTGTEQAFRSELTLVDNDHYKRTIFAAGKTGKETKVIEIDYSRRSMTSNPPAHK